MEAMSQEQLLADVREELDDEREPYLWSNKRLVGLLNEAVFEANRRMRCIVDRTSEEVCRIPLVADQAEYDLHTSVIVVRRAVLASDRSEALTRVTQATMDRDCSSWRDRTGVPRFLVRPTVKNKIIVAPVPTAADVLELEVWRDPLESELMDVNSPSDSPEDAGIEPQHHKKLVHWAVFRAFMKHDAEAEMPTSAKLHLDMFEAYFGPRPTARELQQLGIDPVSGTEAVWF